jgi:hypothetical protein
VTELTTELNDLAGQYRAVMADAAGVAQGLSDAAFNWQPGPSRWSAGQCLEHLNATERAFLPRLHDAIERVRASGKRSAGPTRIGFLMRWFIREMDAPPKRRFRTKPSFVPASVLRKDVVVAEFHSLHDQLLQYLERVNGYHLGSVKIGSPFAPLLRYNLGAAFALIAAHDRRHLWQAREVVRQAATHHI